MAQCPQASPPVSRPLYRQVSLLLNQHINRPQSHLVSLLFFRLDSQAVGLHVSRHVYLLLNRQESLHVNRLRNLHFNQVVYHHRNLPAFRQVSHRLRPRVYQVWNPLVSRVLSRHQTLLVNRHVYRQQDLVDNLQRVHRLIRQEFPVVYPVRNLPLSRHLFLRCVLPLNPLHNLVEARQCCHLAILHLRHHLLRLCSPVLNPLALHLGFRLQYQLLSQVVFPPPCQVCSRLHNHLVYPLRNRPRCRFQYRPRVHLVNQAENHPHNLRVNHHLNRQVSHLQCLAGIQRETHPLLPQLFQA